MRYVLLVLLISVPAVGQPYVEWKWQQKYINSLHDKTVNHLRAGMRWGNAYMEAGPMTDGESFETGVKFKSENWKFKMKWEGENTESLKHKVETEIRYTFN